MTFNAFWKHVLKESDGIGVEGIGGGSGRE